MRELHENRELEKLFEQLRAFGVAIEDYALVQEESVTGERLPTRYAWELKEDAAKRRGDADSAGESAADVGTPGASAADSERAEPPDDGTGDIHRPGEAAAPARKHEGKIVEVANIPSIMRSLHEVGRRGLEIKRFKGLGEMDAEQLWDTTMDPRNRTLMRVAWDGAAEADALFSILMGECVEDRRRYIEKHALEVKNLDV
jgi:DNA gyrase subunit B